MYEVVQAFSKTIGGGENVRILKLTHYKILERLEEIKNKKFRANLVKNIISANSVVWVKE